MLTPPPTLVLEIHISALVAPWCQLYHSGMLSLSESNCLQTIKTPDQFISQSCVSKQEGPCENHIASATFSIETEEGQEDADMLKKTATEDKAQQNSRLTLQTQSFFLETPRSHGKGTSDMFLQVTITTLSSNLQQPRRRRFILLTVFDSILRSRA